MIPGRLHGAHQARKQLPAVQGPDLGFGATRPFLRLSHGKRILSAERDRIIVALDPGSQLRSRGRPPPLTPPLSGIYLGGAATTRTLLRLPGGGVAAVQLATGARLAHPLDPLRATAPRRQISRPLRHPRRRFPAREQGLLLYALSGRPTVTAVGFRYRQGFRNRQQGCGARRTSQSAVPPLPAEMPGSSPPATIWRRRRQEWSRAVALSPNRLVQLTISAS